MGEGVSLFEIAALQGNSEALSQLGMILQERNEDSNKPLIILQMAAERGDKNAAFCLGVIFKEQEEFKKSFHFFQIAAQNGDDDEAEYAVGEMYLTGTGTSKDSEKVFCIIFFLKLSNSQNIPFRRCIFFN